VAAPRHRVDPGRLLGTEPRRQAPGRRRDGQAAQAAPERLAGWSRHRHRDHRDQPHPDRDQPHPDRDQPHPDRDRPHPDRDRPGRHFDRTAGRPERDGR
jgi:hypothetical protein